MSIRKISVLTLLVLVPATSFAQRGRGGSAGSTSGGGGRGFSASGGSQEADAMVRDMADSPSLSKDLQKANPVEIILDRKKDLKLTDAEQKELKTLAGTLKDAVKPYFKTIDSAQREQKKTGPDGPTGGQMILLRGMLRESADSVRTLYTRVGQEAVAKLSEEHRQPATDLLQKEMEAQLSARRGARGGRPPG